MTRTPDQIAQVTHELALIDAEYHKNNQGTSDSSTPYVFAYADRIGD